MSATAKAEAGPSSDAEIVEAYLTASMIPDPDAAAAYMAPGTVITFTGGREVNNARGPTGVNAQRHRWGKKKRGRVVGCARGRASGGGNVGALQRAWRDGSA